MHAGYLTARDEIHVPVCYLWACLCLRFAMGIVVFVVVHTHCLMYWSMHALSSSKTKPPVFDGSTSFAVFKFQFEIVACRNLWNDDDDDKVIELIWVERLVLLTYPGESHPLEDRIKIETFVNGIRDPDIKCATYASQKATFVETVTFAIAQ
ncbi:uncharacterized protein LOC142230890 [Haematobia irritans]|uniref:uncharacterized protein LOC142230890 n=1 Tax=Haematobia irritans TaxID=7368 RepID=UPI003F503FF6